MPDRRKELGALVNIHPPAPSHLQRAAIVAGLSFVFFLVTLFIFYNQQSIGYFILSTAFLVVYIFTLVGWVLQKRNVVSIYENGITYRKFASTWDDIKSVTADPKSGITIVKSDGDSIVIGKSVSGLNLIATTIREHLH